MPAPTAAASPTRNVDQVWVTFTHTPPIWHLWAFTRSQVRHHG
jgi:hypothetical protein